MFRKVEFVNNGTGYLRESISKKALKKWLGSSWLLREKRELRKKLLSKKELELEDLENSQPTYIVKNEKVLLQNIKDMAG